jgi:hypothetical protein
MMHRGTVCSTHGRNEKCIQRFGHKNEGERPLGISRSRPTYEYKMKINFKEISWVDVEWFHLAQDGDQWCIHVNTVMKLQLISRAGNMLSC